MWRNLEVVNFLQWLHAHNAGVSQEEVRCIDVRAFDRPASEYIFTSIYSQVYIQIRIILPTERSPAADAAALLTLTCSSQAMHCRQAYATHPNGKVLVCRGGSATSASMDW